MNCYSGRDGRDIHILTLSTKRKKKQKREINCYYFNSSLKNHYDYNWYRSGDCQHADTAYQYLIANGISSDNSIKVKEELIHYGKELFIQLWMQNIVEDEEIPSKKDPREAEKTFEKILKTGKD